MRTKLRTGALDRFERNGNFQPEEVARLTRLCMGKRTALEFSQLCQVNPSTFTRILQAVNHSPSADELIVRIFYYRDKNCGVSLRHWLHANGFMLKDEEQMNSDYRRTSYWLLWMDICEDIMYYGSSDDKAEQAKKFKQHCSPVIMQDLQSRGFITGDYDAFNTVEHYWQGSTPDDYLLLRTDALKQEKRDYWFFILNMKSRGQQMDPEKIIGKICLLGHLTGEKRISLVTINEEDFDFAGGILDQLADVFPWELSVIQLNLESGTVAAEYFPERLTPKPSVQLYPPTRPVVSLDPDAPIVWPDDD